MLLTTICCWYNVEIDGWTADLVDRFGSDDDLKFWCTESS